MLLSIFGLGIVFFLGSRYYKSNGMGRIRLPMDDFSSQNFQFRQFSNTFKETVSGVFFWICDKLISVKEEISHRLRPTSYRYTPVSSIPRPSFEYVDFDEDQ